MCLPHCVWLAMLTFQRKLLIAKRVSAFSWETGTLSLETDKSCWATYMIFTLGNHGGLWSADNAGPCFVSACKLSLGLILSFPFFNLTAHQHGASRRRSTNGEPAAFWTKTGLSYNVHLRCICGWGISETNNWKPVQIKLRLRERPHTRTKTHVIITVIEGDSFPSGVWFTSFW